MLRKLREKEFEQGLTPPLARAGLKAWAFVARRPRLYRVVSRAVVKVLGLLGRRRGRLRWLPLAGAWTGSRDLPVPTGETFHSLWQRRREGER
jgi:L-lactate dehydrogenase complex protein LldF